MENRFLEAGYMLKNNIRRPAGNGHSSSNGFSTARSFAASKRTSWSGSMSAKERVLVILIENGGVDLGIPELVEKLFTALDVNKLIPDTMRTALTNFIKEKIKSFTDNLIETAELQLNRYNSAAPDFFESVVVLKNGNASYQDLKSTLIKLSGESKIIDLLILTHGGDDAIVVRGDINSQKISDIKSEYGKPLSIRSVYMMNCVGASLNQAWIDAGAKVSSGSIRNNYLPEPTTHFFWSNWKDGQNFENSVTSAYRRTIKVMNEAVNLAIKSVPLLSNFISEVKFENFDFVRDSAPVIQGLRSVTINSDDLTFSQSQSISAFATTVLPVSVLRSLKTSKSFANENTQVMALSDNGLNLIKKFEGFVAKPYNDPVGHCTVGYGTLLHKGNCNGDASEQPYLQGINEEDATKLLFERANDFQNSVNNKVKVSLTQNQYDSLISFVYNIGSDAFTKSTLLKILNEGNYKEVPDEMKKWKFGTVDGKKTELPGLVKRREAEAQLFENKVSVAKSFSAYNYSRPLYDTGEHAIFGEFINDVISGPLATVPQLLPATTYQIKNVPFSYGQIITMADFYMDFDKFNEADPEELKRLKALINKSENHYKNTILGIGLPVSGEIDWGGAAGIGKRYLELALINFSHFAPPPEGISTTTENNKQSWQHYHELAINKAREGKPDSLDKAYPINAFGDHFLTDAFAGGHLINKELIVNKFIKNVLTNGKVNSAGDKMFERIADGALAIPEINARLGRFEVRSPWYLPNWDLNDNGILPDILYRLLVKIMEEPKQGTQKVANLAVKAIHDFLNGDEKGQPWVPVTSNNGKNSWKLSGDTSLDIKNIQIIQLAVKQSVENIEDAAKNPDVPLSVYFQKVWDFVPNLTHPVTAKIIDDAISTFTNPSSDQLITKAVSLIKSELNTLLDELLAAGHIQCIKNKDAKTVNDCDG